MMKVLLLGMFLGLLGARAGFSATEVQEDKAVKTLNGNVRNIIAFGQVDLLKHHISMGASLDGTTEVMVGNDMVVDGTALHLAAHYGRVESVNFLLHSGFAVDLENSDGYTPLFFAAFRGFTECVKSLMAAGANASHVDRNGTSVLHVAAYSGHTETIEAILDAGARADLTNKDGKTPLHFTLASPTRGSRQQQFRSNGLRYHGYPWTLPTAAESMTEYVGPAATVRILLRAGAPPNAVSHNGLTPLHLAAINGDFRSVEALVEHGADPSIRVPNGRLAVHLTKEPPIVDFLSSLSQADPTGKN